MFDKIINMRLLKIHYSFLQLKQCHMIAVFSIDHIIQYIPTFTMISVLTQITLLRFIYIFFPVISYSQKLAITKYVKLNCILLTIFLPGLLNGTSLKCLDLKRLSRDEFSFYPHGLLTRSNINTKFIFLGFIHFANFHFKMTFYFPVKQIAVVFYFILSTTYISTNNQLRKI